MRFRFRPQQNLAALFLSLAACAAFAAPHQLGNIMPGAGIVKKTFLSMREMRYVHMVPQETDFSCGAAAVATILRHGYGQEVTEHRVIEEMMKVSDQALVQEQGFSMLDMKRYVEATGMRGRGYDVKPDALGKLQVPVIALLDIRGYKHFVVLKKTVGDRVYIGDPALGNRVMSKNDFVAGWNGIVFAIIGKGFDRSTVLLNPSEPLTLRQRSGLIHTVGTAQLLEFGFTRGDLF
jgi:predicted double-glycine peptidase